jgi:hypothetical protein
MDAASRIQVITGDDIGRSTALTLPDTLRFADNPNVAQKNRHDCAVSASEFSANVGIWTTRAYSGGTAMLRLRDQRVVFLGGTAARSE